MEVGGLSLEIQANLRKYCRLTEDGSRVDRFVCPVEGCGFTTRLGPGALRMHLLMKSDQGVGGRYCEAHERFCRGHSGELGLDIVRYLSGLPRVQLD